ncbi:hypothetical protein CEXT_716891 [Caerostris extrusa]|uniref:Uncharacterized protein n=1 Tax=Caerostris extrusa TaxID=172846 RepID=A0AAV4NCZ4_CAEEX|nr:hypothetical protein CEXT_716891 [Caerostris extrusa]
MFLKPGHFARDCKHFVQCHLQTISPHNFMSRYSSKKCESVAGTKGSTTVQATMSTPSCMREVLLMTLMVEVVSGNMREKGKVSFGLWFSEVLYSKIYSRSFTFKKSFI